MVVFILFLTSIAFQVTSQMVTADEILNPGNDVHSALSFKLTKRYLGSLAKNKQLPTVQQRSFVPPLISPHGSGQRPSFVDDFDAKEKRYVGALARAGDLNFGKAQQKKTSLDPLEGEEAMDDFQFPNRDDLPNPMVMKQEIIRNLRPVILDFLNEFNKRYDPRKVDLFLENLANAIFDQNEEITLENIKALVQSDYFQPEEDAESKKKDTYKRNIQALVRERNVSYSGTNHPELQSRHVRQLPYYNRDQYDMVKRNLESLIKGKLIKRYLGAMAKNYDFPRVAGKRDARNDVLDYSASSAPYQYNDNIDYENNVAKRHTMYDINEPDITFEYPPSGGDQADYSDYASEQDAAIPIGKRYLGALARSGWLPQGFAALRSPSLSPGAFEKKHVGALARLGWLSSANVADTPSYYLRGGRAREIRPPSFRGPRAYYLKSEPQVERCKCKRSADTSRTSSFPRPNFRELGPTSAAASSRSALPARQRTGLLDKRFLLMPAVDHLILRQLYPDMLLRTTYNGFPPDSTSCNIKSSDCY